MKLSMGCTSCQSDITLSSRAKDKQTLKEEYGEYVHARCKKCGTENKSHVNRIHAETTKTSILISTLLGGLLVSVLLTFVFGGLWLLVFGFAPGALYYGTKQKEASAFNRSNIRRR